MGNQISIRKIMEQFSRHRFSEALREFKETYCDENRLIISALKGEFKRKLVPPILDVGAGLGDIAASAFPELEAILLDVNEVPSGASLLHKRVVGDFFQYRPDPSDNLRTLLLCHVLQYLDDDLQKLQAKVASLNPAVIIEVSNDNDGPFGEMMTWSIKQIAGANPETRCQFFQLGSYSLVTSLPIKATLRCPSFSVMARHFVEILIDAPATDVSLLKTERKLKELLASPSISINQTVNFYERAR